MAAHKVALRGRQNPLSERTRGFESPPRRFLKNEKGYCLGGGAANVSGSLAAGVG